MKTPLVIQLDLLVLDVHQSILAVVRQPGSQSVVLEAAMPAVVTVIKPVTGLEIAVTTLKNYVLPQQVKYCCNVF